MSSILKVDTIQDQNGNNIINESGDTITIGASGDTVNVVGTLQNNGSGVIQGITEADQWRLTGNITTNTNPITSNLERNDTVGFNYIGTGMTVASGTWTFPTTGIWLVRFIARVSAVADDNVAITIYTTINNSTYAFAAESSVSGDGGTGSATGVTELFFDVTDTSTHKVQFSVGSINAGSSITANTNTNFTYFTFIRLGDT
jgi:hypothetical protein